MDTETNFSKSRDLLAKKVKRFTLTYEQHQLLHGAGIGLLASQLAAKRKLFSTLLASLTVTLMLQAGRGLLFRQGALGAIDEVDSQLK